MEQDQDEYNEVDYIPDSWVDEEGIRHAVIFGGEPLPERLRLKKVGDRWEVIDVPVF